MRPSHLITAAWAATVAVCPGNAFADSNAVCLVDVPVRIDGSQVVQTGAGQGRCAGSIGGTGVDPLATTGVSISASVLRGPSACTPLIRRGRIALSVLRLISFDPDRSFEFAGAWTASGPLLRGSGSASGATQSLNGDVRYVPSVTQCTSGRLQLEFVLGAPEKRRRRAR